MDIRGNRPWFYSEHFCISCKDTSTFETTSHILECSALIGKSELVTYLPIIEHLYGDNIDDMIHVTRIIMDNMKSRKLFMD